MISARLVGAFLNLSVALLEEEGILPMNNPTGELLGTAPICPFSTALESLLHPAAL